VRDLHASSPGARGLRGVTIEVGAGELVGVAGVEGNGQSELALAIAGLLAATRGSVHVGRRDLTRSRVADRQAAGLGHVPADRHRRGLVMTISVAENLALGRLAELSPGPVVDRGRLRAFAAERIAELDVRPPDTEVLAGALSGGNQQKLVIGRELSRPGLIALVAAQPTRGVDLGAVARIHGRLRAAAAAGVAILVISADLDELLALCHRVVVLSRGRIAGEVTDLAAAGVRSRIGQLMTAAGESPSSSPAVAPGPGVVL
jgi:simple sugar transport system ATP-binding protein